MRLDTKWAYIPAFLCSIKGVPCSDVTNLAIHHLVAELKAQRDRPCSRNTDGCAIQCLSAELTADRRLTLQPYHKMGLQSSIFPGQLKADTGMILQPRHKMGAQYSVFLQVEADIEAYLAAVTQYGSATQHLSALLKAGSPAGYARDHVSAELRVELNSLQIIEIPTCRPPHNAASHSI